MASASTRTGSTDTGLTRTADVRNVVLLGHTGTGKSTLAEAMLRATGEVDDRGPVVDFEPEEVERGHSLAVAAVTMTVGDCRINVLDTPGGAEAVGDAYPALAAAECAVFVVDASVGIAPQHEQLWRAVAEAGLPRVVFLNKLDLEHASYQKNVDQLREAYGKALAPVHMPIGLGKQFTGVIDLLHSKAVWFSDGTRREGEVPEERREQADRNRIFLLEAVVEQDDELLVAYLEGEDPTIQQLSEQFANGVADLGFFPVLCGSAEQGIGVELLLDFIVGECPSPLRGPRPAVPDGATAAVVVKTRSDQYVGRINLLKVVRGTLRADDHLTNVRTGDDLRLHQLFRLNGKQQLPVEAVAAGDVVAVAKLDDVVTGDVLHDPEDEPPDIDLPAPPEPYHRVVLVPATAGDDDKLSTALHRTVEEDPSIRRTVDESSQKTILSFYGPQHVDVTVARLARKHGVDVDHRPAPIAFRETIRAPARGIGKHVKQSGGHGQYGIAHIEMTPRPRGSGFVFEDAIVGGAIPNQFIPSVEKGLREAMREGPLGSFPVVDIRVKLVDGKHHSVDSSDAAFQMAGILAFRDAMASTTPVLLEPIMEVDIAVPDELTGTVMSDLSGRRGRILGTDVAGTGRTMVHAEVPEVELTTFAAEFRALTSGRGTVALRYHHHQEVPDQTAGRLLEQHAVDGDGG